ncbi:uncharacterized protein LOC111331916 [Stylophora pistillata]|uniref:Uncharacterized protein n=1 Tax=Stylophora pistillata TaxID=50429 RepID=A0A2B4S631_STYPI|nr:uncharacterized protein LOC111331916 [Stylophora pistillata]PFX24270.1 hypothetical protein AWC38_SpisGene11125 [Stylophora pistillata]
MSSSKTPISFLLTLAVFCCSVASCDCKSITQALHFEDYSEHRVKGCYYNNQTLGICFDIEQGSMKVMKTTGQIIVFYQKLGTNMFYYKIIDQDFLGRGPSVFYVPKAIRKASHSLREFLNMDRTTEETQVELTALKTHYNEAIRELRQEPEIKLLERLSATLAENVTQPDMLKPFHALCYSILKTSDIQIPHELRATRDFGNEISGHHSTRQKRCDLLLDPRNNNCTGMCGPNCYCWSWVCGDCCFHQGCLEHDICCEKFGAWSSHCVFPLGFTCESYKEC